MTAAHPLGPWIRRFLLEELIADRNNPNVALKQVSTAQVAALSNVLKNTVPSGGTPLVGATTLAYAYLHQEAGSAQGCAEPCGAPGNRYVVLITDGTDACPMPARAEDAAQTAAAKRIHAG